MTSRNERPAMPMSRRGLLRSTAALAAVVAGGRSVSSSTSAEEPPRSPASGRLKQSACRWCYAKVPLDELCVAVKGMGLVGLDLLTPEDFPTIKEHGLVCTMTKSSSLANGLCDPQHHEVHLKAIHEAIEATAREGWKNVICFSGNARGIDREAGMLNCLEALRRIVPEAEKAGVTLHMELLNSKVNHRDYMCDNTTWGVELVKRVGSDRFKLLYDIYHMQIMEGDVIRTIEANKDAFGHFHTGGVPGRHELDDTQELNYKAIARAIADTGFDGYFAHEFNPTRDPLTSLREAVTLCTV